MKSEYTNNRGEVGGQPVNAIRAGLNPWLLPAVTLKRSSKLLSIVRMEVLYNVRSSIHRPHAVRNSPYFIHAIHHDSSTLVQVLHNPRQVLIVSHLHISYEERQGASSWLQS